MSTQPRRGGPWGQHPSQQLQAQRQHSQTSSASTLSFINNESRPQSGRWSRGGSYGFAGGNRRGANRGQRGGRPQHRNSAVTQDTNNGTTAFLRDEDVLIAFMPYLKGDNEEATMIHENYQSSNDQKALLKAAREFLEREKQAQLTPRAASVAAETASTVPASRDADPSLLLPVEKSASSFAASTCVTSAQNLSVPQLPPRITTKRLDPSCLFSGGGDAFKLALSETDTVADLNLNFKGITGDNLIPSTTNNGTQHSIETGNAVNHTENNNTRSHTVNSDSGDDMMRSIQNGLDDLVLPKGDSVFTLPGVSSIWSSNVVSSMPTTTAKPSTFISTNSSALNFPITPPRPTNGTPTSSAVRGSPWDPIHAATTSHPNDSLIQLPPALLQHHPQYMQAQQQHQRQHSSADINSIQSPLSQNPQSQTSPSVNVNIGDSRGNKTNTNNVVSRSSISPIYSAGETTPVRALDITTRVSSNATAGVVTTPTTTTKKENFASKRLWMHFDEQPGRILVDGCSGQDSSLVLPLAPRQELYAHWSLPLDYLRSCRSAKANLEDALTGLTVGLFRRGCTENGAQASIISKLVLGDDNRSYEYGVDPSLNLVRGRVPFYSPRTPGHVLFRLYWEHESIYTLAVGPTLHVRVTERDFDSSIRFILSNFKGKKSNPTSLSSLHSLAQVMETQLTAPNESAARAVWGCIQEARKVVEACAQEFAKSTSKLSQLEEAVEDLKKQVEEEDTKSQTLSVESGDEEERGLSEMALSLREKTRILMSGRASSERKWRDSQLAFAGILKATVNNSSMNMLLRRDLITKMKLEFELWCPFSEEFAIPNDRAKFWYELLRDLSQNITSDDFQLYAQARVKMQQRTLAFEPNTLSLDDVLFPRNRGALNHRSMDPGAVNVFNSMSSAMGKYYQDLNADEEKVAREREAVREHTEKWVQECAAFPNGTQVVIFGSSANGFGSPKSDIDMCLQLPPGIQPADEDKTGSQAMAKLGELLVQVGLQNVDTARLTARIPVIKFECPAFTRDEKSEEEFVECDLSMHNPLAVLNTSLLRTYADITPVTRVLAAIIKRWAKARDINNPARHTLSSYGYIIMLLHFLTYHKRTGNGLVTPVAPAEGNPQYRKQPSQHETPLLPNLQWMDPMWPTFPQGVPYREILLPPRNIITHPIEAEKRVNTYFYKPNSANEKAALEMLFPGQDLSLAILLASFFRYYAYDFDYKRHVVSLHSTAARGILEREVKAEVDGWRNYSAALTIEDPFETFYDVAHVLRGGYYHRIRREFAVAYSKIADAAAGRAGSWNKSDLRTMTGRQIIDWICEPVANEREQQVTLPL